MASATINDQKGLKLRCPMSKSLYIFSTCGLVECKIRMKAEGTYEHVRFAEQQHRIDNYL